MHSKDINIVPGLLIIKDLLVIEPLPVIVCSFHFKHALTAKYFNIRVCDLHLRNRVDQHFGIPLLFIPTAIEGMNKEWFVLRADRIYVNSFGIKTLNTLFKEICKC